MKKKIAKKKDSLRFDAISTFCKILVWAGLIYFFLFKIIPLVSETTHEVYVDDHNADFRTIFCRANGYDDVGIVSNGFFADPNIYCVRFEDNLLVKKELATFDGKVYWVE